MNDKEQKSQLQPETETQQKAVPLQPEIPTKENSVSFPVQNQKHKRLAKRHWICLIGGIGLVFQAIIIIILITALAAMR